LGNLIKISTDGILSKESLNLSSENIIDIVDNNLVYLNENRLTIKGITIELPLIGNPLISLPLSLYK